MHLGRCCHCGSATPFTFVIGRSVVAVGQQPAEIGDEAYQWTELIADRTSPHAWAADLPALSSGEYLGTGLNYRYTWKMYPMRYTFGQIGNSAASATANMMQTVENRYAWSSLTPPDASHLGGLNIARLTLPCPAFSIVNGTGATNVSRATFIRVLVDDVDVTGIVPISSTVSVTANFEAQTPNTDPPITAVSFKPLGDYVSVPITIDFDPNIFAVGKSIKWDVWFEIRQERNSATSHTMTAVAYHSYKNVFQRLVADSFAYLGYSDANLKRKNTDTYTLTFSDNGPGGASSLTFQATTGWEFVQQSITGYWMRHTATGDVCEMSWNHEHPEIRIYKTSQVNVPSGNYDGWLRYFPSASGHYDSVSLLAGVAPGGSNDPYEYGVWNPNGSTTFEPQGRLYQFQNEYFITLNHYPDPAANFPATITVTKA